MKTQRKNRWLIALTIVAMLLSTIGVQVGTTEKAEAQGWCDYGSTMVGSNCYSCPSGYNLVGSSCKKQGCHAGAVATTYSCARYQVGRGWVYESKVTFSTPATVTQRRGNVFSATWNAISHGVSSSPGHYVPILTNSYNSTPYAQNSCGSSGAGSLFWGTTRSLAKRIFSFYTFACATRSYW